VKKALGGGGRRAGFALDFGALKSAEIGALKMR